jgi:hypothetical protein
VGEIGTVRACHHRTHTRTLAALRVMATTRNGSTNTSAPSSPSPSDRNQNRNPGLAAAHELKILKHGQQKSTKSKDKIQVDATKFALLLEYVVVCGSPTQTLCLALSTCTLAALQHLWPHTLNHCACHPRVAPKRFGVNAKSKLSCLTLKTSVLFMPSYALFRPVRSCSLACRGATPKLKTCKL